MMGHALRMRTKYITSCTRPPRAATVTNRKCFGYSGSGRGTRNGAVTEIVHA